MCGPDWPQILCAAEGDLELLLLLSLGLQARSAFELCYCGPCSGLHATLDQLSDIPGKQNLFVNLFLVVLGTETMALSIVGKVSPKEAVLSMPTSHQIYIK